MEDGKGRRDRRRMEEDKKGRTDEGLRTTENIVRSTDGILKTTEDGKGRMERRRMDEDKKGRTDRRRMEFTHHENRISPFPAHSYFSSLSLPVPANAKSIGENRSLIPLPPLLHQFSLLTVTISRWNRRHCVSSRFVDSVVPVPWPNFLINHETSIVSDFSS